MTWIPVDHQVTCFCLCRRKILLTDELQEELYNLWSVTNICFDQNDPMHQKIFKAIYFGITGKEMDIMLGKHWENVGFLGLVDYGQL